MFVGLRLLEGSELALEQRPRHEVAVAGGKPSCDEVAVAFQKDDGDIASLAGQNIAVGAFECRAGDDAVVAGASRRVDPCAIPWSQGQRSSSVSGSPPCIFSMLDGGWNQSPSS